MNNPSYELFDMKGVLLDKDKLKPNSKNSIKVNHKGVVIFVVNSKEETKTFKTVF